MDPDRARRIAETMRKIEEYKARALQGVSLSELRGLSEAELLERQAELVARAENRTATDPEQRMRILESAKVYADELVRREAAHQEERMESLRRSLNRLTKWVVGLTVLIAIATVVGLVSAGLSG